MDKTLLLNESDLPIIAQQNTYASNENVEHEQDTPIMLQSDTTTQTQKERVLSVSVLQPTTATGKGSKQIIAEKKINSSQEDKCTGLEATELLGSVTTHTCPGTRTSARVIQKMKLDLTRPTTPPMSTSEVKSTEKTMQKTPSQVRTNKPTWSNLERNYFFDALNEFGKDFESLGNYINAKLKRKSTTDISYKTKEQVRQHYYQTYHKICKYVRFSEEIKKIAQELYALINYGEMRRKLQFVTDKHFMKLKQLVYQGHITVRCKGKNIRVKTPSCKALRKLNQLDDSLEDIRLPSKIEVIVSPANMESYGRVQSIAQNPRVRTTVPLHKKLNTFIKTFEYKWRSNELKLTEEAHKLTLIDGVANYAEMQQQHQFSQENQMCFLPKPGVPIHRPLLSITEYLSSLNLCLTAYEERMGIKVRSETLSLDRIASKRQRTESGSEKRSPDTKKIKNISTLMYERQSDDLHYALGETQPPKDEMSATMETTAQELDLLLQHKSESSSDELSDEPHDQTPNIEEVLLLKVESGNTMMVDSANQTQQTESTQAQTVGQQVRTKRAANIKTMRSALNFKPLVSDEVIRNIRKGWTSNSAADITIGDLYVVLGQDSRLELEYYWLDVLQAPLKCNEYVNSQTASNSNNVESELKNNYLRLPYSPIICDDVERVRKLSAAVIGSKLKHLLTIANLSERIRKRQCSCGHICDRNSNKGKLERDQGGKTFVTAKLHGTAQLETNNGSFRQPQVPVRRQMFGTVDPVKQLSTLTRQKMSRQILVQRLLLPGGGQTAIDLPELRTLQDERNQMALFYGDTHQKNTLTGQKNPTGEQANSKKDINDSSGKLNTKDIAGNTTTLAEEIEKLLNHNDDVKAVSNNVDSGLSTETSPSGRNSVSLPAGVYDDNTNSSIFNGMFSPMHFFRESSSNSRWLEENLNDFSLTSLLGHLDEINATRDVLDASSNISVISESSVDFRHKFQEISALLQSQEKE